MKIMDKWDENGWLSENAQSTFSVYLELLKNVRFRILMSGHNLNVNQNKNNVSVARTMSSYVH